MTFKLSYDNPKFKNDLEKELRKFPNIDLEAYDVILFTERKKAFRIKGGYGAKLDPFGVLIDNEKRPVIAFYSESGDCTIDNIISKLKSIILYEER